MSTTLPLPVEFDLSDDWMAVRPAELGVDVAFVALRREEQPDGRRATITISGAHRSDGADLFQIADESVAVIADSVREARMVARDDVGADGLTQLLRVRHDGVEFTQCQVFLALHDRHDASRRVVLELALTATTDRIHDVVGDFEHLVSTLRPDSAG